MRVGIVVPHIFMHRDILPQVIFSPAQLALRLADGLVEQGVDVTLFSPGPVATKARNRTADLSYFERELTGRGDTYVELLKKHPFTFITLARQVQSELIAQAYAMANAGEFDVVHVYTNEEELALPFAELCIKPVVFTHHDPFNFLVKYKNNFPKYAGQPWISLSYAQRKGMPDDTHWVANIYHGLPENELTPVNKPSCTYVAYLGRIIEPKGVRLAVKAVQTYNKHAREPLHLKIAGKHYAGHAKDNYWQEQIAPELDQYIEYVGYVAPEARESFLGNASALLVPSLFEEPFGMVCIEALACGTPVVGLNSGAIPEIIADPKIGSIVPKSYDKAGKVDDQYTAAGLAAALEQLDGFDRKACRAAFETRFTARRMIDEHLIVYKQLTLSQGQL